MGIILSCSRIFLPITFGLYLIDRYIFCAIITLFRIVVCFSAMRAVIEVCCTETSGSNAFLKALHDFCRVTDGNVI